VVALGAYAWAATLPALARQRLTVPRPRPRFGHGVELTLAGGPTVLGCFHPSQQNTFTGRLTEPMLDAVLARAAELAGGPGGPARPP
jgi:uracil-DNA glycosylase